MSKCPHFTEKRRKTDIVQLVCKDVLLHIHPILLLFAKHKSGTRKLIFVYHKN